MALTEKQKELAIELAHEGKSIKDIRLALNVSIKSFFNERKQDVIFERNFAEARQEGLEELADGLLNVADEYEDVQRARVKSENLRWILSKRKPLVYGDRIDVNVNQTVNITGALEAAKARLQLPSHYPDNASQKQVIDITKETSIVQTDSKSVYIENPVAKSQDEPDIFS